MAARSAGGLAATRIMSAVCSAASDLIGIRLKSRILTNSIGTYCLLAYLQVVSAHEDLIYTILHVPER